MCLGIAANKEKIGNLLVLLADRLKPLYQTKMIKLVYLIDESKVKDNGVPLTWLDYKVWQYGPVAPELFYLRDNNSVLNEYVEAKRDCDSTLICPKKTFDDAKFSERDLRIIEDVIKSYGNKGADALVGITHKDDSLWSITKREHNLEFTSPIANTSDVSIDLSRLIDDEEKRDNFEGAREMMMFKAGLQEA